MMYDPNQTFFDKMDTNSDGSVTKEEAIAFWGSNFAKVSTAPPAAPLRSLAATAEAGVCLAADASRSAAPHAHTVSSRPRSTPRPCSTRSMRMETTASRELGGWQRGLGAGQPQQPRPA